VAPASASSADRADDAPARAAAAAVLSELVQSLHDESDALVSGDVEALARAVQRKDRALRELAPQLRLAGSAGLRDTVRGARDVNQHNARMLAARMQVTRPRVESLLGVSGAGTLYSHDGLAAGGFDPRTGPRGIRA
jgi:flagellar biosynthesis/type III secretory pathway chaperone